MQILLESTDRGFWDALVDGPFVPTIIVKDM